MCKFEVSDEDLAKIKAWLTNTVYPTIIAKQKETNQNPSWAMKQGWENGIPYGAGLTYHFTPTSIGTVFRVTYGEHELDLSDYENW